MKEKTIRSLAAAVLLRITETVLPAITSSVIAKRLGPSGQGMLSWSLTLVSCFMLFPQYGIRESGVCICAAEYDSPEEKEKTVSGLFGFQILAAAVSAVLYLACTAGKMNRLYLIQALRFPACALSVFWLAEGTESFGIPALCTFIQRLLCAGIAFSVIPESPDPLKAWALVTAGSEVLKQLAAGWLLKKNGIRIHIIFRNTAWYFHQTLRFFLPVLAMHVFSLTDRTLLGMIAGMEENGYYACADRIVHIPFGIISGSIPVFLPAMIRSSRNPELFRTHAEQSLQMSLSAGGILCGTVILLGRDMVLLLYGESFAPAAELVLVLCPLCILKSWTVCFRNLYLIPAHAQRYDLKTIAIAACVNAAWDLCMIHCCGGAGAAAGTVLSELTLVFLEMKDSGFRCSISAGVRIAVFICIALFLNALLDGKMELSAARCCMKAVMYMIPVCLFLCRNQSLKGILQNSGENHD